MMDRYTWRVSYHDGRQLEEQDAESGFASVDQTQVSRLRLLLPSGIPAHIVTIPDGAQAVFFRRRTIALSLENGSEQGNQTVHCIGWKKEDSTVCLFVFDDGTTLLATDLQAV